MTQLQSIINQGFQVWNNWVMANPNVSIVLKNENYSNFDFRRYNLSKAKFNNSNLFHTNFSHSVLNKALFCESYLRDAIFINTQLQKTNYIKADLCKALFQRSIGIAVNFQEANLSRVKMENSQMQKCNFMNADLRRADMSNSDFSYSSFYQANLRGVNLKNTNLRKASFVMSNLTDADLSGANLEGANLQGAQLISANLDNANLDGCHIYGISAWGVSTVNTIQTNLLLTRKLITRATRTSPADPVITIDNLEVAQFIYLLLTNSKIRTIIDTITSKVVLIIGRFTPERLFILNEIRHELRNKNYLPVLFDFENAKSRDFTETVSTLAHLSRFIIADLTEAKSIPQELSHIIPALPSVPIQPILHKSEIEYSMFEHFKNFPWVLKTISYKDADDLRNTTITQVIINAEEYLSK